MPNEQDGASSIVALDRATGETRWLAERRTEKTAYATPCLFQLADGQLQLLVNSWAHGFRRWTPAPGNAVGTADPQLPRGQLARRCRWAGVW